MARRPPQSTNDSASAAESNTSTTAKKRAPKKPVALKWRNPRGIGLVYVRRTGKDGWLWTSVGGKQETTKIRWPEAAGNEDLSADELKVLQKEAIADAMAVLKMRVVWHEHPELKPKAEPVVEVEPEPAVIIPSLLDAWEEFTRDRLKGFSPTIKTRYRLAYAHFLMDPKRGFIDIPLDYSLLKTRITSMRDVCTLADSTRQKVLYKLNDVLKYFMVNGWLDKNPLEAIGIPKVQHQKEVERWRSEELEAFVKWFREDGQPKMALLYEFAYATGMRLGETEKLRWEHITPEYFQIHGKRTAGNPTGMRYFPIVDATGRETVPGLQAIIEKLRRYEVEHDGWVFPWRSSVPVQKEMVRVRKAHRLNDGRSFHNIRKAAAWRMREELGYSVELISELLGHSIEVHVKHYRKHRTPSELAKAVGNARPNV